MRTHGILFLTAVFPLLACLTTPPPPDPVGRPASSDSESRARVDGFTRRPLRSVDGLDRVKIALPGVLELREQAGIGSYDALLIPEFTLSHKDGSAQLTEHAEEVFLRLLRDSLVTASEAASLPVLNTPGPCVMEINMAVHNLDLDLEDYSRKLAEMTLVMQFRDSTSRQPLLRYATENRIANPQNGEEFDTEIRRGLAETIKNMDIAAAFRASGYGDDEIDPRCQGTLAKLGRAAAAAAARAGSASAAE